jgi:hypothetical protein
MNKLNYRQGRFLLTACLLLLGLYTQAQNGVVSITNITNTQFTVNWTNMPGATGYELKVDVNNIQIYHVFPSATSTSAIVSYTHSGGTDHIFATVTCSCTPDIELTPGDVLVPCITSGVNTVVPVWPIKNYDPSAQLGVNPQSLMTACNHMSNTFGSECFQPISTSTFPVLGIRVDYMTDLGVKLQQIRSSTSTVLLGSASGTTLIVPPYRSKSNNKGILDLPDYSWEVAGIVPRYYPDVYTNDNYMLFAAFAQNGDGVCDFLLSPQGSASLINSHQVYDGLSYQQNIDIDEADMFNEVFKRNAISCDEGHAVNFVISSCYTSYAEGNNGSGGLAKVNQATTTPTIIIEGNPAVDVLRYSLSGMLLGDIEATVYDLSGRVVSTQAYTMAAQGRSYHSQPINLANGIYLLSIRNNGSQLRSTFQVLK